MPQALLLMVFIMMFMVLALNIILFTMIPQYVQYGNQKYSDDNPNTNGTHINGTKFVPKIHQCTTKAPEGILSFLSMTV